MRRTEGTHRPSGASREARPQLSRPSREAGVCPRGHKGARMPPPAGCPDFAPSPVSCWVTRKVCVMRRICAMAKSFRVTQDLRGRARKYFQERKTYPSSGLTTRNSGTTGSSLAPRLEGAMRHTTKPAHPCKRCGKASHLGSETCKALCHSIPRCEECGNDPLHAEGLCFACFQLMSVPRLDGMEGGMTRGSKTADLEARGFDLSHPTPFVRGV